MQNLKMAVLGGALCLGLMALGSACGGGRGPLVSAQEHAQQEVETEYLLQQAGFKKYQVNQNMPQQEALLSALPRRTIVSYQRDGEKLHAYGDKDTRTLYIGDNAAFQRYLSLARGRKLCALREGGGESAQFWRCLDEYRQGSAGPAGK
uniref:Uncharacterized protein n=1 Tax=Desulfobacca acetoxidans TaxID=60893 RepID=A0A7C3V8Z8_9BACT